MFGIKNPASPASFNTKGKFTDGRTYTIRLESANESLTDEGFDEALATGGGVGTISRKSASGKTHTGKQEIQPSEAEEVLAYIDEHAAVPSGK